jgi:hypothetical protein
VKVLCAFGEETVNTNLIMSTDGKINIRLEENIYFALWIPISIFSSLFFSLYGLMFFGVRTMDLHKESSAPGGFARAAASIVRDDIIINLAIILPILTIIAIGGFFITRILANLLSSLTNHQFLSRFLYGLFIFNAIILYTGALACAIQYWQERAPFF